MHEVVKVVSLSNPLSTPYVIEQEGILDCHSHQGLVRDKAAGWVWREGTALFNDETKTFSGNLFGCLCLGRSMLRVWHTRSPFFDV